MPTSSGSKTISVFLHLLTWIFYCSYQVFSATDETFHRINSGNTRQYNGTAFLCFKFCFLTMMLLFLKHSTAGGSCKYLSSWSHISASRRDKHSGEKQEQTLGSGELSPQIFSPGVHMNFLTLDIHYFCASCVHINYNPKIFRFSLGRQIFKTFHISPSAMQYQW